MSEHEGTPVWDPAERREERERNDGARIADNHACQCCGRRGFVGLCPECDKALNGGGS